MNDSTRNAAVVLRATPLAAAQGLVHGFSTRQGGVSQCFRTGLPTGEGDLNLGFTQHDTASSVEENRRRFLRAMDADGFRHYSLLQQKHTSLVRVIASPADATENFLEPARAVADGSMTDVPGVLLTVQTADCVPVLLFDPKRRAVAAFHAGWRGTVARIVEEGAGDLCRIFGSNPADLIAAVGPSIGPESYVVGDEVRQQFRRRFPYADALFSAAVGNQGTAASSQVRLNLWEANRHQLLDAGLPAENITVLGEDTAVGTNRFFSYRAEGGKTGRMMSAIGLLP